MKLDALQTGLYAKLIADAPLMALITGVYADPQQQPASEDRSSFPYVVIGEDVGTSWDTKTDFGTSASVVIDVYSRSNNLLEVKQIAGAVKLALHYTDLTIIGANHVMTVVETISALRGSDGVTKRAIIQIRVVYDGTE